MVESLIVACLKCNKLIDFILGFDLKTGKIDVPKPPRNVCFVINPFASHLNICKTVSEKELERFLSYCKKGIEIISKENFQLVDLFLNFQNHALFTRI